MAVFFLLFFLKIYCLCQVQSTRCYLCQGSVEECSNETLLQNSSVHTVCHQDTDQCAWGYKLRNNCQQVLLMGCASRDTCQKELGACKGRIDCYSYSCCDSDFCNKPKHSDFFQTCKRRPNLVAVISGEEVAVTGLSQNFTMSGSLSYDPETKDNKGMTFAWRYGKIKRQNNATFYLQLLEKGLFTAVTSFKHSNIQDSGRFITINTDFVKYSEAIIVNLTVEKDYRISSVFQVVHLVTGDSPNISQSCVINCGSSVIPSLKISIKLICDGSQCSNITSYSWVLYKETHANEKTTWGRISDFQLNTSTPLNSNAIVIKQNSLDEGRKYRLVVYVGTAYGIEGMSSYDFSTASLPFGGKCSIEPASGISFETNFTLRCSGWNRNSSFLLYQFKYQLQIGLHSEIYHGVNNSVISQLPHGSLSNNYTLNFTVIVTDKNNASSPVVFSAQVLPGKNINPETIDRLILAENSSLLNEAIAKGDLDKAVQIANPVLQVISQDDTLDQGKKKEIIEFVVKRILSLQVKSIADLLQSSSVIGLATQVTDTVSVTCLRDSLTAIDSMTSLLMSKATAKNTADIPLIKPSAENLGTCLNNMLKAGAKIASGHSDSAAQGIDAVTRCMQLVNNVSDAVLELSLPDEEMILIQTSGMTFTLGRHRPAKLAGFQIQSGDGKFVLPDVLVSKIANTSTTSFVDTQMLSIPFNPFSWNRTSERVHSTVLSLDLKDDKRKTIKVSQLSNDVLIKIPLKDPSSDIKNHNFSIKNGTSRLHKINVGYENVSMQLQIRPEEAAVKLTILMRFGHPPTIKEHDLNGTVSKKEWCIWTSLQKKTKWRRVCSSNGSTPIVIFIQKPGKYYVEVRSHKNFTNLQKEQRSNVEVKIPSSTPPQRENAPVYNPSTDHIYTLGVALGSCVYWSDTSLEWTTEGCQVTSASVRILNCSCNHLTAFGASLVKPNPLDVDKILKGFKDLEKTGNVAVIVTVAVVLITYFVLVVILRRADRKDDARRTSQKRELPTASSGGYQYEITITTGIWRDAGTTAKVAMEIYGTQGKEIIKLNTAGALNDSLFYRGSSEVFILSVEKSLGYIRGVRIGHDNSGMRPSWFLEDVVILDKLTLHSWTFSNSQWLALERCDGRIERMLASSTGESEFNKEVFKLWRKGLTEKHIWVSVYTKPLRERFSRVQRVSCCLSILLSAMFANALFSDVHNGKSMDVIQVGPLTYSWRQVIAGIQSVIVVTPVNILIAFLFEKGSSKTPDQRTLVSSVYKWLVYVAWFLCFCTCTISALCTIFYSIAWERTVAEQWLSQMLISFVEDFIMIEPVKVFLTATILATIKRRKRGKSDPLSTLDETDEVSPKGRLWKLEISEVEGMRKRQAKKINISRFFVELFVFSVFAFVLMVVCYGNKNDHRYRMTKSIGDGLPGFHKVFNNTLFWNWSRDNFIPGVFSGDEAHSIYIGDNCSVRIGMPRIRQLRVTSEPCDVLDYMKKTYSICYHDFVYSEGNEDITPCYKPGWIPVDNSTEKYELNRLCPKPWRYQKPGQTDTVPKWGQFSLYPGGGYVADLDYKNKTAGLEMIKSLKRDGWLDRQTRAIILEFSAFNPAANLLVVATYFYEILPSGFKAPFNRTKVISVYSKETGLFQFYLICILLFIIFVLMFVGNICYNVYKKRWQFFKSFWNWVEIFQVIFSVVAVVMNIARSYEAISTTMKMKENIKANVNFQEVIAWIEAEDGILGILVFLITLKLLRLIRYNKQVAIFSRALKESARLFLSFMVVFVIGFVAFMHFGILVFGKASENYSSPLKAIHFQIELILGKVKERNISELLEINRTVARIFASFLLLSHTIFFMNLFIAAINNALLSAKKSVISNRLYDIVDEPSPSNGEMHETFYDVISERLKQRTTKDKDKLVMVCNKEAPKKPLSKSVKKTIYDIDSISTAIVPSRPKTDQLFMEKTKTTRAKKQLRPTPSTKDIIIFHTRELSKKENYLFQQLDNILQADYEEEKTFDKISEAILALRPKKSQKLSARTETTRVEQLRHTSSRKNVTTFHTTEMRKEQKYSFQQLDNTLHTDCDLEASFDLFSHKSTPVCGKTSDADKQSRAELSARERSQLRITQLQKKELKYSFQQSKKTLRVDYDQKESFKFLSHQTKPFHDDVDDAVNELQDTPSTSNVPEFQINESRKEAKCVFTKKKVEFRNTSFT